jgi:DNA-binding transcriptional ArsR family regulator
MTEIDRVIHEPARLLVVGLLNGVKEADFLWLLHESGLTRGNLSSHLAKLEEAGYVEIEKTFRGKIPLTILRLTRAGRAAFAGYRKAMSSLLAEAGGRQ